MCHLLHTEIFTLRLTFVVRITIPNVHILVDKIINYKYLIKENRQHITGPPQDTDNNKSVPPSIDVVTLEPEENASEDNSAFSNTTRARLS